jgi:hypothetical protein
MRADDGDLARLTNRSWSLLFASNTPPWLYRCGGGPSWVERDNETGQCAADDRGSPATCASWSAGASAPGSDLVPTYPPPVLLKSLATPVRRCHAGGITPVVGGDGC